MRANFRIVFATVAVFATISGIFVAIHGLFFEQEKIVRYGAATVILGVAAFVLLLNPLKHIDEGGGTDAHTDLPK